MNRDEVLAKWDSMTPRERDALIAEKVMGWKERIDFDYVDGHVWRYIPTTNDVEEFNPSESISAAWEVVEELNGKFSFTIQRLGDYFCKDPEYGWEALFTSYVDRKVIAKTVPEAICKAALFSLISDGDDAA